MSTQYGWAASSILEFELVLPDATIISVTESTNPDLFRALKGGGNAYGVVSSFLLQAYRQGDIWGGVLFYFATPATDAAMLRAIRDFTEHYPDEKAAVIPTAVLAGAGILNLWVVFAYYNGPEPPPGTFDNFTAIGPFADTCRTQRYHDLLTSNNFGVLEGKVYHIGTETMPLPSAGNMSILEDVHDHWRAVRAGVMFVPGMVSNIAYQPFPKGIARLARQKGGDLLGFDDSVDRIIVQVSLGHTFDVSTPRMQDAMRRAYVGMRERIEEATQQGRLPEAYLPLFLNDLFYEQDYFGRLRPEMAQLAAKVQQEVDPRGVFRDRTGGSKP